MSIDMKPSSLSYPALVAATLLSAGCGGGTLQKQNRDFFTSGSQEADQRASQRMAKAEQLTGSGEGAGEKGTKKANPNQALTPTGATNTPAQAQGKLSLYKRLGS